MLRRPFTRRILFRLAALLLLVVVSGLSVAPARAATTGTLKVIAVDANGVKVKGLCYRAYYGHVCDANNANGLNGIVILSIPVSSTLMTSLYVNRVPPGFLIPEWTSVKMIAGQQTTVRLVLKRGASTLVVSTAPQSGGLVVGIPCYMVIDMTRVDSPYLYQFACDDADGAVDGVIRFGGMVTSIPRFRVHQDPLLAGYYPNEDQDVTFTADGSVKGQLWVMEKAPASAKVKIRLLTNRGSTVVTGGCFAIVEASGRSLRWNACDGDDGSVDGWTLIRAVRPYDYLLTLTNHSSLGLEPVRDIDIRKVDGTVLSVTVNSRRQINF